MKSAVLRAAVLVLLLIATACTNDSSSSSSQQSTTTTAPPTDNDLSGCADGLNCTPEACPVSINVGQWDLYAVDAAQDSWRIAVPIEASAPPLCLDANPAGRIAVRGMIDGEELDLFGEGEGTIGYQRESQLQRGIALVVQCDDDLAEVGVVGRSWIDDLPVETVSESVELEAADCANLEPTEVLERCGFDASGEVVAAENGDATSDPARISITLNSDCPNPPGFVDPQYFAALAATTGEGGDAWNYADAEYGERGLPIRIGETAFADFAYGGCGPNSFLDIEAEITVMFQEQPFETATVAVTDVPCGP